MTTAARAKSGTAGTAFIGHSNDKNSVFRNPEAVGAVGHITPRLVVKLDSGTDCLAAGLSEEVAA